MSANALRSLVSTLSHSRPVFKIKPSNISILSQPIQFHDRLLDMIKRAKQRIFLSSLYIGPEEHELHSELQHALERNQDLTLTILLDLNRSTRPEKPSSTVGTLLPLLRKYPTRTRLSLFRSPHLRGPLAALVPPRFKEGWGTWHAKIYGIDDEVMISGANLNKSYFTDRQDRYIHISSSPAIANYCSDFMDVASSFSYSVQPNSARRSLHSFEDLETRSQGFHYSWPKEDIHPHAIHRLPVFQDIQGPARDSSLNMDPTEPAVYLSPIIQAGQFGVTEENETLEQLVRILSEDKNASPTIDFTSGYFGLNETYQKLVLNNSWANWKILAASPQANGFFGSKGISGRIPEGYTYLEQRFMNTISSAGLGSSVQLHEWHRPGWTYHAKGIWVSPSPNQPPNITVFGSTNFNSRSSFIDTELSFVLVAPGEDDKSMTLRRNLASEVQGLREYAGPWKGKERPVRLGTKALVKILGGML
ncbi:CDP-diacylglycerol-glycerol-3-phosphate 3-phosphatidyltransferase [Flagelloscypha sp. PMI_526]|nr:CDP-diacylglycerol-glycerol-3-phosphate 3-phosphatidyltransferase [Flagelloscypha sp. PMI_526]